MTRQDVTFRAGDEVCAAWLFLPPGGARGPVVVMAHGLGAVKEMRLDAYAERFVDAGYACLVFDYRHFGASGGEPRQLLDVDRQLEDWAAAIAHARTLDGVDPERVVVWGTSFGGGHVILTASRDHRLAAAIAQCPFTDGLASARVTSRWSAIRVSALALADAVLSRLGRRTPLTVRLAGPSGSVALMSSPDSLDGYSALVPPGLTFDERVAARVALRIGRHRPGRAAAQVRCSLHVAVCENDTLAPARATRRLVHRAPGSEVRTYAVGHFDIYLGAPFEAAVADQVAFLARHVPA